METKIVVAIADPNEDIRKVLNETLSGETDIRVAGSVSDGASVMDLIRRTNPDVLVMDLILPGIDGLGILERLNSFPGKRPIVILTSAFARRTW
jgi:two-component system response regulator (stage 0 sporulation protein A)